MRGKLAIVLLLLCSCTKDPSPWTINNLSENEILVFGHGGMGEHHLLPMDSKSSLLKSLETSAGGTEMDVQLSSDGHLVLFHDDELQNMTEGNGPVRSNTAAELTALAYKPTLFVNEKIITATDFFSSLQDKARHIFTLECKLKVEEDSAFVEKFVDEVVKLVKQFGIEQNTLVESYNAHFLELLGKRNNKLRLFVYAPDVETGIRFSKLVPVHGITLDRTRVTEVEIFRAHKAGLRVTVFNINNTREASSVIRMSPDFIQVDDLETIVEMLK